MQEYIEIIKELSKCFGIEQSLSQAGEDTKLEYERQLLEQKEQVKVLYDQLKINGNDKGFIEFLDGEYGDESDLYLLIIDYMCEITKDMKFQMKYMQKHLDEGIRRNDDLFLLLNLDFQVRAYAFSENMHIDFQKQWDINKYLGERLKQELNFDIERIPLAERNKDIVVVVTSQIAGMKHAPTVKVLEYCYVLKKLLNKEVVLFNVALKLDKARLSKIGCSYVNDMIYREDLSGNKKMKYKDEDILIYQMQLEENSMSEFYNVLEMIKALKPLCIWNMATIPAVMELTNMISTNVYTHFCQGYAPVQTDIFYNYFPSKDDESIINREFLNKHSIKVMDLIKIVVRKSVEGTISRGAFGIPENAFVLGIVGNRLESECTLEFMKMLEMTILENSNIYALFIGSVSNDFVKKNVEGLKCFSNCKFAGFQNELLECMNVIDILVNPLRLGGGASGNNALFLGKPIITVKKGDIYSFVGDDFAVDSLVEYNSLIKRYYEDKEFYQKQSERAFERYKELVADDEKLAKNMQQVFDMIE